MVKLIIVSRPKKKRLIIVGEIHFHYCKRGDFTKKKRKSRYGDRNDYMISKIY